MPYTRHTHKHLATAVLAGAALCAATVAAAEQASATEIAKSFAEPFATEVVEIELAPSGESGHELEHAVPLAAGAPLLYSWKASGGEVYFDFHGHTAKPLPTAEIDYMQLINYGHGVASEAHGSLIAPFAGKHGWYFRNDSAQPVAITLQISGYHDAGPESEGQ